LSIHLSVYIKIILSPLIGAAIGWATNAIAIWMLFHPYKEYRIGNYRIPFTPGLIPSRIEELAGNVANIISNHLFTSDEWLKLIDSLELDDKVVDEIFNKLRSFTKTYMFKLPFLSFIKNQLREILKKELKRIIKKELRKIFIISTKEGEVSKNIEALIRERIINEFEPRHIENVIFKVCKKELYYIMFFGGILGMIIGFIQGVLFI